MKNTRLYEEGIFEIDFRVEQTNEKTNTYRNLTNDISLNELERQLGGFMLTLMEEQNKKDN